MSDAILSVDGALKVGFSICQCGQGSLRLPVSQLGQPGLPAFESFEFELAIGGGVKVQLNLLHHQL